MRGKAVLPDGMIDTPSFTREQAFRWFIRMVLMLRKRGVVFNPKFTVGQARATGFRHKLVTIPEMLASTDHLPASFCAWDTLGKCREWLRRNL